jgi:toxin-antitoxin system PIN domain toxin
MKIVDLNVLLYALNEESSLHDAALAWWETAMAGSQPVGLAWVVIIGFLRISTNPRVFPKPLSSEQALERVDDWLRHYNTRLLHETDQHWRILRELLTEAGTAGNLTTDAHLAALAISHGATLVSFDRDFHRFRGLRCESPEP